jgi:hypothetical protein
MRGDDFLSSILAAGLRPSPVLVALAATFVATTTLAAQPVDAAGPGSGEPSATYAAEITKRADKIVAPLSIVDEGKKTRVRDLIAAQYQTLSKIHAARDARIAETKRAPSDAAVAEGYAKAARDIASLQLVEAHRRFVARLAVELTPEEVDKIKDGLTYGVVGITYKRYLELLPNLRDEEKREILANLIEARELAMDGGSSEEKHAVFGKYKGRINNYLSKAGYNMKQAEKDLAAKQQAASLNQ